MPITSWSLIAASNDTADPAINWQEGQPAGSVNNSARAVMSTVRAFQMNLAGSSLPGGSANVITIANNQPMLSLTNNVIGFFAGFTNTGAVTFNVDGLGALALVTANGSALVAGQIIAGNYYLAAFNAPNNNWVLLGAREAPGLVQYFADNNLLSGVAGEGRDWWTDDAPPLGWVYADGRALVRTDYPALFARMGTKFGAGNGTTTFNIPDKRGRLSVAKDNMGGTAAGRLSAPWFDATNIGNAGGAQSHTLDINQMPSHTHGVIDPGHTHGVNDPGHSHIIKKLFSVTGGDAGYSGGSTNDVSTASAGTNISIYGNTTGISTQGNGGGGAHNNIQPTITCNYIICTGKFS